MYKRLNRRETLKDFGKYEFGFDQDKELILYKFYCGIKLGKSEWRKVDKEYIDGECSHLFWKEYIRKKYIKNHKTDAFEDYIKQCSRKEKPFKSITNIVNTAVITSIFTTCLIEPFKILLNLNGNINIVHIIVSCLCLVGFIFLSITASLIIGLTAIYGIRAKEVYKANMYNDILGLCQEEKKKNKRKDDR